jgi:hypothetical protein
MESKDTSRSIVATGKKWALILSGIAAIAGAVVPLAIGYLNGAGNVSSHNNSSAAGRDINNTTNSNTTISNNYFYFWKHGIDILRGSKPATIAPPQEMPQRPASQPASVGSEKTVTSTSSRPAEPGPGELGRLVANTSLMNDSTWTIEPSIVPRSIEFTMTAGAYPICSQQQLVMACCCIR